MSDLFLTAYQELYDGTKEEAEEEWAWRTDKEKQLLISAWMKQNELMQK